MVSQVSGNICKCNYRLSFGLTISLFIQNPKYSTATVMELSFLKGSHKDYVHTVCLYCFGELLVWEGKRRLRNSNQTTVSSKGGCPGDKSLFQRVVNWNTAPWLHSLYLRLFLRCSRGVQLYPRIVCGVLPIHLKVGEISVCYIGFHPTENLPVEAKLVGNPKLFLFILFMKRSGILVSSVLWKMGVR